MTDIYQNLKLCTFLFVSDKFDSGNKLFDSFLPLVECVLAQIGNQTISFLLLQSKLNEIYSIEIPKATLNYLLNELKLQRKIRIDKNRIFINGELLDSSYVRKKDEKEQETNELFLGFREFLLQHDVKITFEDAKKIICSYIFTHCYDLADFIGKSIKPDQKDEPENISLLFDFLLYCKYNNLMLYSTFLRLYKGAVQSTLLNFNPEKIETLNSFDLHIKKVILDTNFLMRVLDIQTELEGQIAIETYNSLTKRNIEIVVLQQTIEEIKTSIKSFLSDIEPYSQHTTEYFNNQNIRMSGLLSALQRGKSRTYLLQLTKQDIITKILAEDYQIKIINDFDTLNLQSDIDSLIETKARIGYGKKQANHDLSLINYCRKNRGKNIDTFPEAKCWVLTNDIKLTYWCQNNSNDIQECLLESQFANLVWMQSPKEDNLGLINTMVTLANKELIDSEKFYRFIDKMQAYKESIKDNKKEIDNLSLVLACESIKTADVNKIIDEDQQINELFREKTLEIHKENEEKELILKKNVNENLHLKFELKVSQLINQKLELTNSKNDNLILLNELRTKKANFIKQRDDTFVIDKIKKRSGRWLALIIMLILLAIPIILLGLSKLLDIKTISTEWLAIWISALTIIFQIIVFFLTAFFTGSPMNPIQSFNYFRGKISKRLVKKEKNITLELHSNEFNMSELREKIDNSIMEISENEKVLFEKQQDIKFDIDNVERELTLLQQ